MGDFSILWASLIVGTTILIYKAIVPFIQFKKDKTIWLVSVISICVYSGIGIAYSSISKQYILEYIVYLIILGVAFSLFVRYDFVNAHGSLYAVHRKKTINENERDCLFWNSSFTARIFICVMILYFLLRFGSLIYPVNKLTSLSFIYNAVNNLKNISGENATILNSMASYIKPMAYIGMYYAFKKVRYVAAFLGFDLLITLLYSGYLSRSFIICVLFIALMLYFNNDLSDRFISLGKKKKRVYMSIGILGPFVLYMMIYLMTIRTTSRSDWTIMSFFSSEIDYPKHYSAIEHMAGSLMTGKDMVLHILDSFVPFVPTPEYTSNLNVLFSEIVTGVTMDLSWFSVLLPSLLGEAKLIFGAPLFGVHAVIIAFMLSMITRITKDKPQMIILYYYYLTCVMKAARGGYAELSSTVMFNIVIMDLFITGLRLVYSTTIKHKG